MVKIIDQRIDKKGYMKQYYKRVRLKNPEKLVYLGLKSNAKVRNIPFSLQESDIKIPKKCPILGIPLKKNTGSVGPDSPSVDRINNKKGYHGDNIRVISNKANTIKSDLTVAQAKKLVKYMEGTL